MTYHRGSDQLARSTRKVELTKFDHRRVNCIVSEYPNSTAAEHTLWDCQCRGPLIFKDIQANASVAVDVGMVDFGCKVDLRCRQYTCIIRTHPHQKPISVFPCSYLWRFERIVRWKVDRQEKNASLVWAILLLNVISTQQQNWYSNLITNVQDP